MKTINPIKIKTELSINKNNKKKKRIGLSDLSKIIVISSIIPLSILAFMSPILIIFAVVIETILIMIIERIPFLKRLTLLQ